MCFQEKDDEDLFENHLLDGNYLEYRPKNLQKSKKTAPPRNKEMIRDKKMSIEEIYDEFWEFITDDNPDFQEFILKDKRRKKKQ